MTKDCDYNPFPRGSESAIQTSGHAAIAVGTDPTGAPLVGLDLDGFQRGFSPEHAEQLAHGLLAAVRFARGEGLTDFPGAVVIEA